MLDSSLSCTDFENNAEFTDYSKGDQCLSYHELLTSPQLDMLQSIIDIIVF